MESNSGDNLATLIMVRGEHFKWKLNELRVGKKSHEGCLI